MVDWVHSVWARLDVLVAAFFQLAVAVTCYFVPVAR